ncbi:ATP-binding protein [Parvibaculum sp.]|uniref:Lon protease family protein n=1 Tax=Parvibaculum sp. TaxID=2024848 RepID=UPI002BBC5F71|nr:ATP-binding protein [Parvibaculum sp.]HUD52185.1 ATP-binding protein [Parvibaculum sp.]
MAVDPIPADLLYRACDLSPFTFETTVELEDLPGLVGQDRVLDALRFGTGIKRQGYNLFVLGPDGAGKHEAVTRFLATVATRQKAPSDWAYVNNFQAPNKPIVLEIAAGLARVLKESMGRVVEELKATVPSILESEEYQNRRQSIDEEYRERQEQTFEGLRAKAEAEGIALLRTPAGFALAPVHHGDGHEGEVLKPDEFNALPEAERKRIEGVIGTLQKELAETLERIPAWEKEHRTRIQKLNSEVAERLVEQGMRDIRARFETMPAVRDWLGSVATDLIDNIAIFASAGDQQQQQAALVAQAMGQGQPVPFGALAPFRRYEVNVVVENNDLKRRPGASPWQAETEPDAGGYIGGGAPIVYEDHPTLQNLVGRVEHLPQMGALITDFMLIKGGSLHRANGGYLLIDALKILREPLAWDALKRTLRRRKIIIESPGEFLSLVSTVSLEPDPVPLDLKVILFGDRYLYYVLSNADPEFGELFKVAADFEDEFDREPENDLLYARMLAGLARKDELLPLDKSAVGRSVERASRIAEDAEKISTAVRPIADLLREADYIARLEDAACISARHVDEAIDAQIARADRMRERSLEMITRDIVMIDTEGEVIGQVNGLSVLSMGTVSFGRPSRITARVRMGLGGSRVLDIEREVDLGGPIHSKGVLILSGYLSATFLPEIPFSMSASLVFEQSYGGIDGDSASSAELYALISALAEVPIVQGLAVTGSVNQLGEVQAIGGVNDKIEGFFDICMRRGLTGEQGVLIPAANVKHLMLRQDVVDAVERGMFAIYPVERIEEGVELLMGRIAGVRGPDGKFTAGGVYALAEARLAAFAENQRRFAQRSGDDSGKK